jgi:hypothetical protein
LNIQVK